MHIRKAISAVCVLALVAAGCGGDANSCETIADDGIDFMQDSIDAMEGLSFSDVDSFDSTELESRGADLERRLVESECTEQEFGELMVERMDRIQVGDDNPMGEFLMAVLEPAMEDGSFSFGS